MQIASSGSSSVAASRSTPAQERLGVRDRGRSGEDGRRGELERQRAAERRADRARAGAPNSAAERRAGDALDRLAVVGVAVERAAERGWSSVERDADQRDAARERPLERERPAPSRATPRVSSRESASRRAQRRRVRRADERAAGPPWRTVSAAVTGRRGRSRRARGGRAAARRRRRSRPGRRLGVVHLDAGRGSVARTPA